VDNELELTQHVFKMSVLYKYIKLISRGGVLHVFTYTNVGHLKVQTVLHGSKQCRGSCYHSVLQVGESIFLHCVALNIRFLLAVFKERAAEF
jgi:hypothetical protein